MRVNTPSFYLRLLTPSKYVHRTPSGHRHRHNHTISSSVDDTSEQTNHSFSRPSPRGYQTLASRGYQTPSGYYIEEPKTQISSATVFLDSCELSWVCSVRICDYLDLRGVRASVHGDNWHRHPTTGRRRTSLTQRLILPLAPSKLP
ncbi:hypothetical protein BC629DRAFT_249741 [Irpex lacteus]|nr:hypothetical protein BC629DRAFT_249741 [Irpex lacteus]